MSAALKRKTVLIALLIRDGSTCSYCEYNFGNESEMTLDHVLPRSLGGGNEIDNLVLACYPCNQAKAADPSWSPAKTRLNGLRTSADRIAKGYC